MRYDLLEYEESEEDDIEALCGLDDNSTPLFKKYDPIKREFLSVGSFHNQHVVNQAEHMAVARAHVAALSSRRLHRLLNSYNTALNTQLAPRPGLDAGLVVAQKATVGLMARVQQLASPVSIFTAESSATIRS